MLAEPVLAPGPFVPLAACLPSCPAAWLPNCLSALPRPSAKA